MTQSSTLLLLKVFRLRLALCAAAAFAIMFGLTAALRWNAHLPELIFLLPLLAGLLRMHTYFYEMPFPVGDRQAAWLPLGAMALTALAALAGLGLGVPVAIGLGHAQAGVVTHDLAGWLRWIPAASFFLLFALRVVRYNAGFIGFFGFVPVMVMGQVKGGIPGVAPLGAVAGPWPWVLLAGALFLFWEAPAQWALLRRLTLQPNNSFVRVVIWDLNGPMRIRLRTRLADFLMFGVGLTLLVIALRPAVPLVRQVLQDPVLNLTRNPLLVFLLLLVFIPVILIRVAWMRYRASGYGPLASALLILVPFPLKGWWGIGFGSVARCGFCGGYKFAWRPRCPHCREAGVGQAVWSKERRLKERRISVMATDPVLMIYRLMIPLQLIFFTLMLNAARWLKR